MSCALHWNGTDLPVELRDLPAGRYILDPVDDLPALTAGEEECLRWSLHRAKTSALKLLCHQGQSGLSCGTTKPRDLRGDLRSAEVGRIVGRERNGELQRLLGRCRTIRGR